MNFKDKYIHRLIEIRQGHAYWVGMIKLLASEMLKDKSELELNIAKIDFGKWLYEEGALFRGSSCSIVIDEIENLWNDIHNEFMLVYQVCVQNQKRNIFGLEKRLNQGEKQLARYHYEALVVLSDKLQSKLRNLEKQLQAKSQREFEIYESFLESKEIAETQKETETANEKSTSSGAVSGARGAYYSA